MTEVEDTYCEAFDGIVSRAIVTADNDRLLRRAVLGGTALPSTVVGRTEAGLERWLSPKETPDGRPGAMIQAWGNWSKDSSKFEYEYSLRIRQGILVVPTTRMFNALDSEKKMDTMERVGHCGDGFERTEKRFGRELINVPIMMGEFLIERYLGLARGVAGGNLWLMCDSLESSLEAGERAIDAISKIENVVVPFDICSAGSKVETKYPEIGPTTNELYCPALRDRISNSLVPNSVESISEIVINGLTLDAVKNAMRAGIKAVDGMDGVVKISAGNYGGKLGKYKIFLREL